MSSFRRNFKCCPPRYLVRSSVRSSQPRWPSKTCSSRYTSWLFQPRPRKGATRSVIYSGEIDLRSWHSNWEAIFFNQSCPTNRCQLVQMPQYSDFCTRVYTSHSSSRAPTVARPAEFVSSCSTLNSDADVGAPHRSHRHAAPKPSTAIPTPNGIFPPPPLPVVLFVDNTRIRSPPLLRSVVLVGVKINLPGEHHCPQTQGVPSEKIKESRRHRRRAGSRRIGGKQTKAVTSVARGF